MCVLVIFPDHTHLVTSKAYLRHLQTEAATVQSRMVSLFIYWKFGNFRE